MPYNNLGVAVIFGSRTIGPEILEILDAIPTVTLISQTCEPEAFLDRLRGTPDLVLVELEEGVIIPDWLEKVTRRVSPGAIILCAPHWHPDFLIEATQAGFRSFLTIPFTRFDLEAIINKIDLSDDTYQPGRGKVIVVTGYKGGVGVTTVAINLAMALGENTLNKVALVDLGFPFPDVARFIDKEVSYSLSEVVEHGGNVDVSFLKKLMQPYASNLDILNGYVDVEGKYRLETKAFEQIISSLRRMYHYIVIDLGQLFDELFIGAMKQSDMVIMVTGLTIADLKNFKTIWPLFTEWAEGPIKIKVVVNRLNIGNSVQVKSLEQITRGPVFETLPSDYQLLMDALFQGAPVAIAAPRSKLWHKIENLAKKIRQQMEIALEEPEVIVPEMPAKAQSRSFSQSHRVTILAALSLAVLLLVIMALNYFSNKQEVPHQATAIQDTKDIEKAVSPPEVPPPAKVIQDLKKIKKSLSPPAGNPGTTVTPAAPEGQSANPSAGPSPENSSMMPPSSAPNPLATAVSPSAPVGQAANPVAAPSPEKSTEKETGAVAGNPASQAGPAAPQVQASEPGAAPPPEAQEKPKYVGSITSNKYHYPDCKWAKTILPGKLIGFKSMAEAKEKGYIPCPTCKPPRED